MLPLRRLAFNGRVPEAEGVRRLEDLIRTLTEARGLELERIDLEVKSAEPLDARSEYGEGLAKAAMALANYGGGLILIGFRRGGGGYDEEPVPPEVLATREQTRLHDLLERFSEPTVSCVLYQIEGRQSRHPVVEVLCHGVVPHVCRRDGRELRRGAVYCHKRRHWPRVASIIL